MSAKPVFRTFNAAAKDKRVEIAKDNAQPRIKPPEIAKHPPPGLAPPGMSGIRTEKRFVFRPPPTPEKAPFSPQPGNLTREFKSLVQNQPGKTHDIER